MKPSSKVWQETLNLVQAGVDARKWPPELRPTTDGATAESLGFYRLPRKEPKLDAKGRSNGQSKIVGYEPVAVTILEGELKIFIGDRDAGSRGEWDSSFLTHPISEEVYRAVAERGEPWPDFAQICDRCGRQLGANHACLPEPDGKTIAQMREENPNFDRDLERTFAMADAAEERKKAEPQIAIKQRLDALKGQVSAFAKIESDEQSSAARGLQARFLELRGEAAEHYEKANRPLLDQQKKLREIWFPIRDEADDAKTVLGDAMGAWEDVKRAAAKRASDEAARQAREHAAAVAAAEAANRPAPPPPGPERPNLPMPTAQIKAAGARTANVKLLKIVTEIDVDKAFSQFKAAPEVREVLMSLAQRAVTAGLPVDGATIEERSKVR